MLDGQLGESWMKKGKEYCYKEHFDLREIRIWIRGRLVAEDSLIDYGILIWLLLLLFREKF